jgi:acyl dehydratase
MLTTSTSIRKTLPVFRKCVISLNTEAAPVGCFHVEGTLRTHGTVVGSYATLTHSFSTTDVAAYANLAGDNNPIHFLASESEKIGIKDGPIVHGLLVSGLFPTMFGRTIQGSLYLSQNLNFRLPVLVNEAVIARIEVKKTREWNKGLLLQCSTVCTRGNGDVVVDGEAKVWVPKTS